MSSLQHQLTQNPCQFLKNKSSTYCYTKSIINNKIKFKEAEE